MVKVIDLKFLDTEDTIASFAVADEAGYTLVECGPYSTHDNLIEGLRREGIAPEQVHTLLLTHIHFDHAGAAWWWAARGVRVLVHPRGLKHMIDPTRLYESARQIYGDRMDELWGRMEGIDPEQIASVEDRQVLIIGGREWVAHHTPGHASHHIAWQVGESVFTGDVGGCRIQGGPVVPPCPPPDINVADWQQSIGRLQSLKARTFYLTHFGEVMDTEAHLAELSSRLDAYFDWILPYYRDGSKAETVEPLFKRYVTDELTAAGVGAHDLQAYLAANPPYMSVVGMLRALQVKDRDQHR